MAWNLNDNSDSLMAEINITPLTDVMLVLLVIFMVTTPLIMMDSFKLKLPQAETASSGTGDGILLAMTADGTIYIDNNPVAVEGLFELMKDRFAEGTAKSVILRADTDTDHGRVIEVLDIAKKAGAGSLSIATERINN